MELRHLFALTDPMARVATKVVLSAKVCVQQVPSTNLLHLFAAKSRASFKSMEKIFLSVNNQRVHFAMASMTFAKVDTARITIDVSDEIWRSDRYAMTRGSVSREYAENRKQKPTSRSRAAHQ